jgi:hypothetical protein
MGYSANYGRFKIAQWTQSHPEPVSITRATTLKFWRGFPTMLPALTILTGFDGKMVLCAHRAVAPRVDA